MDERSSDTRGAAGELDGEMPAEEVVALVSLWEQNGLQVWIDGGWAVDALLGDETRRHRDLDIALTVSDLPRIVLALHERFGVPLPDEYK
jgi:lincosamide nucleotidyltransferase A/C/D/E